MGQKRKRSAPAHNGPKARGWKPDRAVTLRIQGAVHDSRPLRGEPPSLRNQGILGALATADLQRGTLPVSSDFFADFIQATNRASVTGLQAAQACRHRLSIPGDHE